MVIRGKGFSLEFSKQLKKVRSQILMKFPWAPLKIEALDFD